LGENVWTIDASIRMVDPSLWRVNWVFECHFQSPAVIGTVAPPRLQAQQWSPTKFQSKNSPNPKQNRIKDWLRSPRESLPLRMGASRYETLADSEFFENPFYLGKADESAGWCRDWSLALAKKIIEISKPRDFSKILEFSARPGNLGRISLTVNSAVLLRNSLYFFNKKPSSQ